MPQMVAAWIGIAVGGLTIITTLGRWFIVTPLKAYIATMTHPIQPDANGGKSLPDVAVKLTMIDGKLQAIEKQLTIVDKRLDRHIEQHVGGEA